MDSKLSSLLLGSLHQDGSRLDVSVLAALTAQDWADLLVLAGRQRVAPLLYHNLRGRGLGESLPEESLQALRNSYMRNTARNLRLVAEFGRTAAALDAEGIPVIALKGIHLAHEIYENIGLREMNDIDLLVQKPDLSKGTEILMAMGFKPAKSLSPELEPITHHLPRLINDSAVPVEVHHTLAGPAWSQMFDILEVWERARPMAMGNTMVFVLSPEDVLLYLSFHNAMHAFGFGMRPYCDIQAAIRRFSPQLDWDAIVKRAKRWRWERGVYLSLRLARDLVGAGCPDSVLDALEPDQDAEGICAVAMTQVFADKRLTQAIGNNVACFAQMRACRKAGLLVRRLFPSRLEMAHMYHVPRNSLRILFAYPIRWRDVVIRHWAMLQAVQGRDEELTKLAEGKGKLLRWLADGR